MPLTAEPMTSEPFAADTDAPPTVADFVAEAETRKEMRRAADKAELHMAMHEMAEGVRGLIRTAPFASIGLAALLGMWWSRRRARR